MNSKKVLSGLSLPVLYEVLAPLPKFRARQIFKWIADGVASFGDMNNLPMDLRSRLDDEFILYGTEITDTLQDSDGTRKLQIQLHDKTKIEAVLLVDGEGRKTACISTQVGCPVGCLFCKTGSLGFLRNLESYEIVEQFLHLKQLAPELSHIVVMGMGEPMLNLDALREAVSIFTDPEGLGISKRRITVSTSGILLGLKEFTDLGPDIRLAVSLTTADSELRDQLMPISKANPLPELKNALLYYQKKRKKRITLEAVLMKGINTRSEDAKAMAAFAKGLDVVINLIPWNPVDGLGLNGIAFSEPSRREVERFSTELEQRGLNVTLRLKKGRTVSGACGQLGSL